MQKTSKDRTSTATKVRRVARMLIDALKESERPGGHITLDQAFRELEERERRDTARSDKMPRNRRTSRRS